MFPQKKKEDEYEEPNQKADNKGIDFAGIIVNALQMGLSLKEIERMRMGEYVDMFNAYKIVYNMRAEGMKYKLPEKRVSMLDL